MKTVIQVVQHLSPGGIEVMALELKKTNQKDMKMIIVSLEGKKTLALKKWDRLAPYCDELFFMGKREGLDIGLIFRLMSLFKRLGATAVHTHHIGPLIYGGLAACLAGIKKRIHTEHDAWHLDDTKRRWVEYLALSLTKPKLVADADTVAEKLATKLHKNNVSVIKNGIDVEHFCPGNLGRARERLGLPSHATIIGCAGRLEKVKGQYFLLQALSRLDRHVHLAFAGDGSQRDRLETLTYELDIRDRVHFLGSINDMPTFYQGIDVFCLPSLREGLPLSVLEAQACGIPAVISDTGGAKEALCEHTGYLVIPGDVDSLAQGIQSVLNTDSDTTPRDFVANTANLKIMANAYAKLCLHEGEAA